MKRAISLILSLTTPVLPAIAADQPPAFESRAAEFSAAYLEADQNIKTSINKLRSSLEILTENLNPLDRIQVLLAAQKAILNKSDKSFIRNFDQLAKSKGIKNPAPIFANQGMLLEQIALLKDLQNQYPYATEHMRKELLKDMQPQADAAKKRIEAAKKQAGKSALSTDEFMLLVMDHHCERNKHLDLSAREQQFENEINGAENLGQQVIALYCIARVNEQAANNKKAVLFYDMALYLAPTDKLLQTALKRVIPS